VKTDPLADARRLRPRHPSARIAASHRGRHDDREDAGVDRARDPAGVLRDC
jgi:hypothetical protein